MCGIAGYRGTRPLAEERRAACLQLMHHRGPDHAAQATVRDPEGHTIHLLHTRLSIIDLDARANQPFRVGPLMAVYNGELYNYKEVRACLQAQGRSFATDSDTEALLASIEEGGWQALDRCEGMWAFALHDERDGSLSLCRDRFGEKPLYLFEDSTGLYFGSEVKFLAALLGKRLEVDLDHIRRFLVNGYKALYKGRHAFFRGVEEVAPATIVRFPARGPREVTRYWHPGVEVDESMTYEEAVAGVRQRLLRAVELRLRADVPLAFCMSGGVDSNALISIAKRELRYDVHGFTIENDDPRYDEREMVAEAVRELGIRHTRIPVQTAGFLEGLRELVRAHDAPVQTITYYAHWLLMRSIREHGYHIAVSGTAADELFTGYYDHHLAYLAAVRGDPALHAAALAAWEKHVRPLVRNPHLRDPDLFVRDPGFRGHVFFEAEEFATYLTEPWSEPFTEEQYHPELLRNRMLNELYHEAVPVILHEDDLNAMQCSVENRSPFLDRALFEFSLKIPTRYLVRDGRAKAVLRDAMEGIMPEAVRSNRRKVGFNAPIQSFLVTSDPRVRAALLEKSPIFGLVRRERIEALLDKPELPNSESKFLFSFIACKMFLEEFG